MSVVITRFSTAARHSSHSRAAARIEAIAQRLDPLAEPYGLDFLYAPPLQRDETHAWNVVMMTLGLVVTPCNAEWRWLLDRDDSSWVCRDAAVSPVACGQLARGFFRIADAVRACAAQAK